MSLLGEKSRDQLQSRTRPISRATMTPMRSRRRASDFAGQEAQLADKGRGSSTDKQDMLR